MKLPVFLVSIEAADRESVWIRMDRLAAMFFGILSAKGCILRKHLHKIEKTTEIIIQKYSYKLQEIVIFAKKYGAAVDKIAKKSFFAAKQLTEMHRFAIITLLTDLPETCSMKGGNGKDKRKESPLRCG